MEKKPSFAKKKNINLNLIRKVVRESIGKINPQKVILFGSFAYGQPNANSDVDLLFVKETRLKGVKRYCSISENVERIFPMDIIVKTPDEVGVRLKMGDPFYKEIFDKGKILYEASK